MGTAVQSGARPVIVLLNNGSYGTIRMHQERDYPDRISGTTLVNPDFTAVAQAYGMVGIRVNRTESLQKRFQQLLRLQQVALLSWIFLLRRLLPARHSQP